MDDSSQLTLDLSKLTSGDNYDEHDFVVLSEHQEACDFLDKFFMQDDYSSAKLPNLILKGEGSSGKTHLLNIFANKYAFKIYSCEEVKIADIPELFSSCGKFLVIDDVDDLHDDNSLFHIYNTALENGVFLLIGLKSVDVFELKDLVSRLRNIVRAEIKSPDSDMIKILLSKGFSKRQLKIDVKIIDYLALNIARKYSAIEEIIQKIEKFCFDSKKTVTLGDVKKMTS